MKRKAQLVLLFLSGLISAAFSATVLADESLSVYSWVDYIDPKSIEGFEREFGVKVNLHTYSTADELSGLLAKKAPIDVVFPTYTGLADFVKLSYLKKLDVSLLPHRKGLDSAIMSKLAAVDTENAYSVPYAWGAYGFVINTDLVEKVYGSPLPNSWSIFFEPQIISALSRCGVSIADYPSRIVGITMMYQGKSIERSSPRQIKKAIDELLKIRQYLRTVDVRQHVTDMEEGKICVALTWTGESFLAAKAGRPIKFLIPEEGTIGFIDTVAIPESSPRPDLAHKFIDYLLRPEVAAQTTKYTLNANAVPESKAYLADEIKKYPQLYTTSSQNKLITMLQPLNSRQSKTLDSEWKKFKSGTE